MTRRLPYVGGPMFLDCGTRFKSQLVMPEQRKKKNDRKRNSEQPKQCTSTKTHVSLRMFMTAWRTYDMNESSNAAAR
jgi:hypothetical protein